MKLPLVSVIIPFYNTADYLVKCISSVVEQTYSEIEIILIDDGSTDSSTQIGRAHEDKYEKIFFKRTSNLGPGNARNEGIALSKGELLVFVDSDDFLAPEMIQKMVEAMEEEEVDIAMCKFELFNEERMFIHDKIWDFEKNCIEGFSAVQGMYKNQITFTVWGKIFRKKLVEKIEFPTQAIFEDRLFMLKAFLAARQVYFIDDVLIHVLMRETSLTRRLMNSKRVEDLTTIYHLELAYVKEKSLSVMEPLLHRYHLSALKNSFFMLQKHEKSDPGLKAIRTVLMDHITQFQEKTFTQLNVKDKIHLLLLKLPNWIGWRTARFLMKLVYPKQGL